MKELLEAERSLFSENFLDTMVDLTDGDSNIVYKVDDKYIYKKFISVDQLKREVLGMYLFGKLTKEEIPMLVSQGKNYYLSEFLQGARSCHGLLAEGLITLEQVYVKVASFVAQCFWGYKFFDKTKMALYPFIQWENKLAEVRAGFNANRSRIASIFSRKESDAIASAIAEIESDPAFRQHLTITHRDLNLENVMGIVNGNNVQKFCIIDFEHCLEAPIELEFQNSLLWNDEKSLDVDTITALSQAAYRLPYDKEKATLLGAFYLADQINLAIIYGQEEKIKILAEKARTHLFPRLQ